MGTRQTIQVDYENLRAILVAVEQENSSVVNTDAYQFMRKKLKSERENDFLKQIRRIIKNDPTIQNIYRWYDMQARTGYRVRMTFQNDKYTCVMNTFRKWRGVDMDPIFVEYSSNWEMATLGTTLIKLVEEMNRQVREKGKNDPRNADVLSAVRQMPRESNSPAREVSITETLPTEVSSSWLEIFTRSTITKIRRKVPSLFGLCGT